MPHLPLSGVRVLDLTQALAGPYATMILGDLGADIIKLEPPKGDITRSTPPHYVNELSLYFITNNRNKRGIVIDLKNPRGRVVFEDLVRHSDVVFYNYRPGVAERLRLDHDTLASINPRIVTCSVTGFGSRGSECHRRALDVVVQSVAGAMSITGEPERPPVRAGVPTADLSAGLFAAIGILAALHYRDMTGQGLDVETSLFHTQLNLLNYVASGAMFSGDPPGPVGSGHVGTVPSQVFRSADGWITIDAGFDHHFALLCEAIGRAELATDARYIDRLSRSRNRQTLIAALQASIATRPTREWVELLDEAGVPCGPVNNVLEALVSAPSEEYEAVREIEYDGQRVRVLATPLWFDKKTSHPMTPPPRLGGDTCEVLTDVLGYSSEKIDELLHQGALAGQPTVSGSRGE